jgi:hypothetical protein
LNPNIWWRRPPQTQARLRLPWRRWRDPWWLWVRPRRLAGASPRHGSQPRPQWRRGRDPPRRELPLAARARPPRRPGRGPLARVWPWRPLAARLPADGAQARPRGGGRGLPRSQRLGRSAAPAPVAWRGALSPGGPRRFRRGGFAAAVPERDPAAAGGRVLPGSAIAYGGGASAARARHPGRGGLRPDRCAQPAHSAARGWVGLGPDGRARPMQASASPMARTARSSTQRPSLARGRGPRQSGHAAPPTRRHAAQWRVAPDGDGATALALRREISSHAQAHARAWAMTTAVRTRRPQRSAAPTRTRPGSLTAHWHRQRRSSEVKNELCASYVQFLDIVVHPFLSQATDSSSIFASVILRPLRISIRWTVEQRLHELVLESLSVRQTPGAWTLLSTVTARLRASC